MYVSCVGRYRVVMRHVRYWRGAVQRWSTVYPFTGSVSAGDYGAILTAMLAMENAICYKGPTAGATGGTYEAALYDQATGGVPIAVNTVFPWSTPGAWVGFTGAYWASNATAASNAAETALQVEWSAGLSKSGKPVTFKKWYHSVPDTAAGATPDISSTQATSIANSIQTAMNGLSSYGLQLGNSSRLAATLPTVRTFFGNHQMPRGRRRKLTATQAQSLGSQVFQLVEGGNSNVNP